MTANLLLMTRQVLSRLTLVAIGIAYNSAHAAEAETTEGAQSQCPRDRGQRLWWRLRRAVRTGPPSTLPLLEIRGIIGPDYYLDGFTDTLVRPPGTVRW